MSAAALGMAALRTSLRPASRVMILKGQAGVASASYAAQKRAYATKGKKSAEKEGDVNSANESASSQAVQSPIDVARQANRASAFDVDTSALVAAAEEAADKRTTGARSRGSGSSSQEKRSQLMGRIFGIGLLIGVGFTINHLGREWDTVEEREKFGSEESTNSFFGRFSTRLSEMYGSVKAPVWDKLLPDPLPFPYSRPYTLVLDVDDLLIHSEWSRQHAWRTAKRPGLDYFLGYLSQFYEIVLFSRQPMYIVAPVVEKLDPDMRMISFTLFRESCRMLDNGDVVKDLSHLNRDLSKVIAIDTDPKALQLQPENAIILEPWKGDRKDSDLVSLISFLEAIGIYNIQDVRQTIKAYEGTHIPTEHVKRQKMLKEREAEEWKQKHEKGRSSWIGGLAGAAGSGKEMPKSWYETQQEHFRQGYMEDQKFWLENGEKFRQQAKDEQEKKLKEMKLNAWGFLTGAAMQPPSDQQGGQPSTAQK